MIYDNTGGEPISVEASVDAKGLATLEVTYVAESLAKAWGIAPWAYSGLGRTMLKMRKLDGGGYTVVGTYEGKDPNNPAGGNEEALATYELDFTQAQKPIQVHPRFATKNGGLKDVYKWITPADPKEPNITGFQIDCPEGVKPVVGEKGTDVNPLYGVTDWLDVGAVWRKSWMSVANEIPDSIFKNLGLIDTPEGPVPEVNQGRNWLRSAAKARGRGRSWELSIEWMLSGRGGHEPALYKPQQ